MVIRIPIESLHIDAALNRYLDENKPDPIQKQQINGFTFSWQSKKSDDEPSADFWKSHIGDSPTHVLEGTLIWKGKYVKVSLFCRCGWWGDRHKGQLFFSVSCSMKAEEESTTTDKSTQKVHKKMVERLVKDDYVQKLLGDTPVELCQATIRCQGDDLEERVHCNGTAAEALKRSIFLSADSALDVFDFLIAFPILPGVAHSLPHTSELADRAKLRILEDAMYDACEDEGEEELVRDLELAPSREKKSRVEG